MRISKSIPQSGMQQIPPVYTTMDSATRADQLIPGYLKLRQVGHILKVLQLY